MPRPKNSVPTYQHHRPTGQAKIRLDGRDIYLGKFGTDASKQKYEEIIRKLLTERQIEAIKQRVQVSNSITINELAAKYAAHARIYYVKNGRPTTEYGNVWTAVESVRERFGFDLVTSFGPMALREIRNHWIKSGITRLQINKRVDRVRRMFAWGVCQELVPPDVLAALRSLEGLKKGRSGAKEGKPVRAVADEHVDAIQPFVSRQVWAMISIQRLTAARPGEVVIMRTMDIDQTPETWSYTPASHKTEHHDRERHIPLGKRAREILCPWLKADDIRSCLFSPVEAMEELWADRKANRKTPLTPSQCARSRVARPQKTPRDHYTTTSYNRAIREGVKKANRHRAEAGLPPIPHWSSNQLRHTAASKIRSECGIDATRALLGHSSTTTTGIYAELDQQKAIAAMERFG